MSAGRSWSSQEKPPGVNRDLSVLCQVTGPLQRLAGKCQASTSLDGLLSFISAPMNSTSGSDMFAVRGCSDAFGMIISVPGIDKEACRVEAYLSLPKVMCVCYSVVGHRSF